MVPASLAVIACVLIALAVFSWRAHPERATNRTFSLFALAIAAWTIGIAGAQYGRHVPFWVSVAFGSASLVPAGLLAFSHSYPALGHWPPVVMLRASYGVGIGLAVLAVTTPLIVTSAALTPAGLVRITGPLYPVFSLYVLSVWAAALVIFTGKLRHARGAERAQLQFLGAAIVLPLAGSLVTNLFVPLFTGHSTYAWIGPFFGLPLIILITHAIIRHRVLDLRLVIRRGLTITIAAILSFIPVGALLALAWPRLARHLEPREILVVLTAVVAVTLLVPITRDAAGRLLDRYVYRQRANYRRVVREASRELTRVLDLRVLLPFLRDTVVAATECEGVAIYVRTERRFTKGHTESRSPGSLFGAPEDLPAAVVTALDRHRDALGAHDVTATSAGTEARDLHEHFAALNWALVLPAVFDNTVIGAIALGPKRSGDPFSPEDLDLLMTLANQAGIAIKNARLYVQVVLANEHLENIVSTIDSGVVAVNAMGEVTMINPTAERLTGRPAAEAVGRAVTTLPEPLARSLVASLTDGVARTEPEIALSDGATTRPAIYRTSPLRDPSRSILGAVAVFSDLTPVKALEMERRRAERLAYLEALSAAIAHEVKNPLVAIKTFTQLVPRRRDDDRFVENFSRVVGREIERMERLVTRLRSLSGPAQRPLHPIDVRQPIADALEFLQPAFEERDLAVGVELGAEAAIIAGDGGDLEGLFLNLLINAHQATPPGGHVDVRLARNDGHVTVEVRDSGPGIPADVIDRVFDPFFTTKQRGSGLGLAICAGIADAHHARIGAANAADGGARFTVEFPLTVLAPASVA